MGMFPLWRGTTGLPLAAVRLARPIPRGSRSRHAASFVTPAVCRSRAQGGGAAPGEGGVGGGGAV
jgi:hypothetical protein